ncbi:MAG: carbohydrate ABC transporter permease, partial [Geminicoccaceae bacterium]
MAAVARSRRRPELRLGFGVVRFLYLAVFLMFVLAPLYWVVVTSIKPTSDYLAIPPVWFPAEPTIVHYTAALFAYR